MADNSNKFIQKWEYKHSYKPEEVGTLSTKFTLSNNFSVFFEITRESLPVR